jgi:hypothetical protein
VHLDVILVNDQLDALFLNVFISWDKCIKKEWVKLVIKQNLILIFNSFEIFLTKATHSYELNGVNRHWEVHKNKRYITWNRHDTKKMVSTKYPQL